MKFFLAALLIFAYHIGGFQPALAKEESSERELYIIQMADPPLAVYSGGIGDLLPTRASRSAKKHLDARSSESRAYRTYLSDKRVRVTDSLKRAAGRPVEPVYTYDVVYNGMALRLTLEEAKAVAELPEVLSVQKDEPRHLMMNAAPEYLKAADVWEGTGTGGLPGTKGEGIIIGVIDTGVWPEHPSFADDGTYPEPPAKWGGKCTPPADGTKGYACNNKLIGIQFFLKGYVSLREGKYDGLFYSGRDDNGHGTHTASTAGGNENVPAKIYGIDRGMISGIAPRAHIACYKVMGPGGGTASDSLAAIDKAVADGVDVINYSIGSGFDMSPWSDPTAQAFLAAREAGISVVVSAGNEGPGESSIASPANAPWVTSAGASYGNRFYLSELTVEDTSLLTFYGASPTKGISSFHLVDAEGIRDSKGDDSGQCLNPFPTGTFRSTDAVLCARSQGVPTWAKSNFVQDGGAGAVIFYGDEESYDVYTYPSAVPMMFVLHKTGLELKALLKASQTGDSHNHRFVPISFTQGEPVFAPDSRVPADMVAGFSSRGPDTFSRFNADYTDIIKENLSIIKPDLTAPGIHILAGTSPEYVDEVNGETGRFGQQGELFLMAQGTSMSSPVLAGLAALLRSLHPDWTPSQLQSALMTTALSQDQKARGHNGDIPASPFDAGSGRADVSRAARAGFVMDETSEQFKSANPEKGGDPSALNLPGMVNTQCLGECGWSRTLESTLDIPVRWTVTVTGTGASGLSVEPETFTLEPGKPLTLTVTADVRLMTADKWIFSEIQFTPQTKDIPISHFPVAVRPISAIVPVQSVDIETRRNQGTYILEGLKTVGTNHLTTRLYAGTPEYIEASLVQDTANNEVYDDLNDGIFIRLIDVPATTKRLIVETTESQAPDIDLYIGIDDNGNGLPDPEEERGQSTGSFWNEICTFPEVGKSLESGTYWILIQNWKGSGAAADSFKLAITRIDGKQEESSIAVTTPTAVSLGESFDVRFSWDIPDFEKSRKKFGWLEIGTGPSSPNNIASIPLTLTRIDNDVSINANVSATSTIYPGDKVTYIVQVEPDLFQYHSTDYTLVNTLPDGMTYIPGSATIEPDVIKGNQLVWNLQLGSHYKMTSNRENPLCDTPWGGYVHLEDQEIPPSPGISGDEVIFRFDDVLSSSHSAEPVAFFGRQYAQGLYFTDNGLALLNSAPGTSPHINTYIPNPALPNGLLAPFWQDLEIVYDKAAGRGIRVAEENSMMVIEYDGVEPAPAGSTDDRFDFEILMRRSVSSKEDAYEVIFAYDNIESSKDSYPATVGIENPDGTGGVQYAYNHADIEDGLILCFDYMNTEKIEIRYDVRVDEDIFPPSTGFIPPLKLTNVLSNSVSGGPPATAEAEVRITEQPVIKVQSGDIHTPVPDNSAKGLTSQIEVSRKVAVSDVNVSLALTHPCISDLSAYLISPSGTEIRLFESLPGSGENFTGTVFNDEASVSIAEAEAPFTGTFRPAEPLSAFDGEPTEGRWMLKIADNKKWDKGTLLSWGLEIRFASAEPVANDDSAMTGWDEAIVIPVLGNDRDPDEDILTIISVSEPEHGTVRNDGTTVTYTPKPGFVGKDKFTYTVSDSSDGSAQAEVIVTVKKAGATLRIITADDTVITDGKLSLREAVLAANSDQSVDSSPECGFRDTIILPGGTYTLGISGALDITESVNIIGDSETGTVLQSNGTDRVFTIHEGAEVNLENVTIRKKSLTTIQYDTTWNLEDFFNGPLTFVGYDPRLRYDFGVNMGDIFSLSEQEDDHRLWMTALVHKGEETYSGLFCGGTLIHPRWILTAAHCVENERPDTMDAVIGVDDLLNDSGERIAVNAIVLHPDYDPWTLDSDIALIRLSRSSVQKFTDLIPQEAPSEMTQPGTDTTVTGWTTDGYSSEKYSETLVELSVPIVSAETVNPICEWGQDVVTENMLVTDLTRSGKETYISGSPLMVPLSPNSDNGLLQAGIASRGETCARSRYGIYTLVSQFTDWIYDQIGGLPLYSGLNGGGILNKGILTLRNSTLTDNTAANGGAIFNSGLLMLINSTVSGNKASLGGGICNEGTLRIVFSTIADNQAKRGGGIFNRSDAKLKNTLIAQNIASIEGPDILGTVSALGINLIGNNSGAEGFQKGDILNTDALLVPLRDNRGPALTHAVQVNGPSVNSAGDCSDIEGNSVTTDQRGVGRKGKCDIGAFEYDGQAYPPVASDDVAITHERPVIVDVLANDRDANNDRLSIAEVSEPEHGTLKNKGVSISYTPEKGFTGTDTFIYTVSDGTETSAASVAVTVLPDTPPEIQDDEAVTVENTDVVIAVLSNDRDAEGDSLTIKNVDKPTNGSATTDGITVTYTPDKGFVGTDRFMYRVSDGVKTGKAFVAVTVEPSPEPEEPSDNFHSADYNPPDDVISLWELLRVIQIYSNGFYTCGDSETGDGYDLEIGNSETCEPHDSDFSPQNWRIDLGELMRAIQIYNASGYHRDPEGEDGFVPGPE